MKRRLVCICVLLWIVPLTLGAQETNSASLPELVQALLARIDQLEKRVEELEGRPRAKAEAHLLPTKVAEHSERPVQSAYQEHAPAAQVLETQPTYPSLKLAGFSDFNFSATDQRGSKSGFNEGQFVLHLSSALSPKVNVFGELSLTARPDAGAGTPAATGFNAEVERIFVRFDQSDYFKVSFGRYHTPINWWNTAFHHGQWLQTSISRPEMTQFGGRFIPVHFVGGLVEGALPAGGLNLNYNVGLGNGRGAIISRAGDAGDINNHRAWLVNLFTRPDRPFGLQFGGSVYRDRITLGAREFAEWITSGHLVWSKENPEVIAEFANVNHSEVGRPGSFNSQAYYVQVGYRLPWWEKLWKPYYRFEYIHIPRTEPVFGPLAAQPVTGLPGSTVGLRYDISNFAALKLEYRHLRRPPLPPGRPAPVFVNGAFAQTSFTF